MLSVTIDPQYSFDAVNYSTNQSTASISGAYAGNTGAVHLTYRHFKLDKFKVETLVTGGSINLVNSIAKTWILPNLNLELGTNIVKIQATDTTTDQTDIAQVLVTYISENQLGVQVDPPTGISKEQFTDKVVLKWLNNSSVSFSDKVLVFSSGSSPVPPSVGSGITFSINGGIHTPGKEYFDSTQVIASLADVKVYNQRLSPVGTGTSTRVWDLFKIPVDGTGLNRPTNDWSKILVSGASISGALISGTCLVFEDELPASTEILATYFYNDATYDSYVLKVEQAGLASTGKFSISTLSGRNVSYAQLNTTLTSVSSISWSEADLWVDGLSDLQTRFASAERISLSFNSEQEFSVSSDKGLAGTNGSGRVGMTFSSPSVRFTIDNSGLYTSGDLIVFDVFSSPVLEVGTDIIKDIPGLNLQVLNTLSCGVGDTAIVKVFSLASPPSPSLPATAGAEIILAESGSVNLDTFQLTSAEENPANRVVYVRDIDYVLVVPEDTNKSTLVYRTVNSSIPVGTEVLASFQITRSSDTVKGYNVYASTQPAGGSSGYVKINERLITEPSAIRSLVTSTNTSQSLVNGVRTTVTEEKIISFNEFEYTLTREQLIALPNRLSEDLTSYFVLTAIATDSSARKEIESLSSLELVAKPLEITSQIQEFSIRTFDEIVADYTSSALASQPLLDVKPTSVTRDVHIDPVANEIEKAYVMLDFVNKSQSFLTLLSIDDPENTGSSVLDTEYKASLQTVFNLETLQEVQDLIDSQFDKLASNVNVSRRPASQSRGTVVLYTLSKPNSPLTITPNTTFSAPTDSGTLRFLSLLNFVINPEEFSSYLNPNTRRYEVEIPVIAEQPGSSGNVDAGSITLTNITNFLVTNNRPLSYGSDQESNKSLAERALAALMGVDFGTVGGYVKDIIAHPGVLKVEPQAAGDSFMLRDFDKLRNRNLGGKVDLYVQGDSPLIYQEEFGIPFIKVTDELVSEFDAGSFVFTVDHKIETLVGVSVIRTGSRQDYKTEGAALSGRTVILSGTNPANAEIGVLSGDQILVTYYYVKDFSYELKHAPVLNIDSIDREEGRLLPTNYSLNLADDLFQTGGSAQSLALVKLVENADADFSAGTFTDTITLNGTVPSVLNKYAIDSSSIVVSGTFGTYVRGLDYKIIREGDGTTKASIARVIGTRIPDGESVSVSYVASETFVVRYTVDSLIEELQESLELKEYATADVLVKRANQVPVDISAEIILQKGVNQSEADLKIRTALGRHFNNLRLGESIYQSDIIRILDGVDGVYAVETPLIKLARSVNSYVLGDSVSLSEYSTYSTDFYTLTKFSGVSGNYPLSFATNEGGGILDSYKIRPVGVYVNSRYFKGVISKEVALKTPDSCYIGTDGIYLSNLKSQSDKDIVIDRRTRVLVNYFNYEISGTSDLFINNFEYPTLSNALFSYRNRS